MVGRTVDQHLLPEIVCNGDLRRLRLTVGWQMLDHTPLQALLLLGRGKVLPATVDETILRDPNEKSFQVFGVGELPARFAKSPQQISPDRLNDVDRVKSPPQLCRQAPAYDLAKNRFVGNENLFGG